MKKIINILLAMAMLVTTMTACTDDSLKNLTDGHYKAEYKNFDVYGWKDYIEVTVVDKEVSEIIFDSINQETGALKSADESYKKQMEPIVGTYPAKYNKDLINQFLESEKISSVDIVAGATQSTGSFKTLLISLAPSLKSGTTETILVDDLVAKK